MLHQTGEEDKTIIIPQKSMNVLTCAVERQYIFFISQKIKMWFTLSCNATRLKIWNSIPRNPRIRSDWSRTRPSNRINSTSIRGQQTEPSTTLFAWKFLYFFFEHQLNYFQLFSRRYLGGLELKLFTRFMC